MVYSFMTFDLPSRHPRLSTPEKSVWGIIDNQFSLKLIESGSQTFGVRYDTERNIHLKPDTKNSTNFGNAKTPRTQTTATMP